jgi:hypothetical protein
MGFELYVKAKGTPTGNALSIYKDGQANVTNIKNIEKMHSVEIYVDREKKLIGLVFSERQRLKHENGTFAITRNSNKGYTVNIKSVLIEPGVNNKKRLLLPYEIIQKMYVLDFSKI